MFQTTPSTSLTLANVTVDCAQIGKKNLPKLNPYVAIKALLTMIIPTEVTTLNIHAAASTAAFLSALLDGAISPVTYSFVTVQWVKVSYPVRT